MADEDIPGSKKALRDFSIDDPNFDSSRELILLQLLIDAIESGNQEEYIKQVGLYAKVTPLEKTKSTLFTRIEQVHLPNPTDKAVAGIATKMDQLDFTGKDDDEEEIKPIKKKKKQEVPV